MKFFCPVLLCIFLSINPELLAAQAQQAALALPPQAQTAPTRSMRQFQADRQAVPVASASQAGATAAVTPCAGGQAGAYPCSNVDLLAFLPKSDIDPSASMFNDLWGWTDPANGNEYALVGMTTGTAFIDISDPVNPVHLGTLPTHTSNSLWRDVKVYQNHAFIVSEASGHGMQVFDLTRLRTVTNPPVTFSHDAHYSSFGNAHNIVLNETTGFAYAVGSNTCAGGLHMVDVTAPTSPGFAGCYSSAGYTHDAQCVVYNGPDGTYQGRELCFNANEDEVVVVDVTNKATPVTVAQRTYPGAGYIHQGWLTEDHRYFYQNDESDETQTGNNTKTYIWDVSDLSDPVLLHTHTAATGVIDHNIYTKGQHVYQANYQAGLRILDVSNPFNPMEVGYFDTYPASDGATFSGAWTSYPYFDSGVVLINSMDEGLFLVFFQLNTPLPVELAAFEAHAQGRAVTLRWQTLSETQNAGFEVQIQSTTRTGRAQAQPWQPLAYVKGAGTTQEARTYTYRATDLAPGRYRFRLKQVDTDGGFTYSEEIEATVAVPGAAHLAAAYPNPFGPGYGAPATTLRFTLQESAPVTFTLYDLGGRAVRILYQGRPAAGTPQAVHVEAAGLPCGTYVVRLQGPTFAATQQVKVVQ